jgi:hypothetical protein
MTDEKILTEIMQYKFKGHRDQGRIRKDEIDT